MKKITAEGVEFYYDDSLIEVDTESLSGLPPSEIADILKGGNTRFSLFKNLLPPNQQLPYWLVWQDGTDLNQLDSKVRDGVTDDCDFVDSFRTIPVRANCRSCNLTYRVLVIDPGDPYPGAPSLHEEKIKKLKIQVCPNCGTSLKQLVAKIISRDR